MYNSAVLKRQDLLYPEESYKIVGSAFDVYNQIGPGHLEKYYQKALAESFSKNSIQFVEQASFPIKYNDKMIGRKFFDFLVDNKIVVEIKKGTKFSKANIDQVLEYLRMQDLRLAILISFGSEGVMFKRIINVV